MTIRIGTVYGVLLLVCAFGSAAHATPVHYGAYVWGTTDYTGSCAFSTGAADNPAACLFDGTDPRFWSPGGVPYEPATEAAGALLNSPQYISGFASLATGDLSVALSSGTPSSGVTITALMWDTLTFHFADGASHEVTVRMAGGLTTTGGATGNARYRLELAPCCPDPTPNQLSSHYLLQDGYVHLAQDGPYTASSSLMVSDGMVVNFLAMLWLLGGGAATGNLYDPITFDIPDGGSFTSESGVFLTQDAAPVPEPATLLLVGTGMGFAALRRRSRRVR